MEPAHPIQTITIISENDETSHTLDDDISTLSDSVTETGTAFVVHESDGAGSLVCTTVYPMPGHGGVVAIEIVRG